MLIYRESRTGALIFTLKNRCVNCKANRFTIYFSPLWVSQGMIELPIRVNLDDRPRQLVCFEHGKKAITIWKVLHVENGKTRVEFTPVTGRTHQLRVHSAHISGLNMPITGDDLYGSSSDRLYLHASQLIFKHPITGKKIHITSNPLF